MGKGNVGLMECCGRTLLSVINTVLLLIGVMFLAAGIFLTVGIEMIMSQVDGLMEQLPEIAGGVDMVGVTVPTYIQENGDSPFNLGELFASLSKVFIIFGVFMVIIGFLGCCGACCKQRTMLIVYAVIVTIISVIKILLFVLFAGHKFDGQIREQMKTSINEKYGGIDDMDLMSVAWNFAMIQFKCCGVDGYRDFYQAKNWERSREFQIDNSTHTVNMTMAAPVACCVMDGTFPQVEPVNANCTVLLDSSISNYNKGCWNELQDVIVKNTKMFAAAFVITFLIEFACIAIAITVVMREKERVGYA